MKKRSTVWLFVIACVMGISILSLPHAANAQDKKDKKTTQQKGDDKDEKEKISRKDKKKVRITMEQAKEIALKRVPGTITEQDLEKEKGRLQYAFDIKDANGKVWDVEIDAITGDILKAEEDNGEDDDNGSIAKAKNGVVHAAKSVKNATWKGIGKIF